MLHGVAIQEVNRCALLHNHDVRHKHQSLLVHDGMVLGGGKSLTCDGIDVNHRVPFHSGNFALDVARPRRAA
jgi:hypothetical protein